MPQQGVAGPAGSQGKGTQSAGLDVDLHRVLAFCPWSQRAAAAVLSREIRERLGHPPHGATSSAGGDAAFHWRFLLERLAEEHNVHVPAPNSDGGPPPGVAATWKGLFLELFPTRGRLDGTAAAEAEQAAQEEAEEERFSIRVATRFRAAASLQAATEETAVVLPLHQKVQILRDRFGCTRAEAMQMIMKERGLQILEDPFFNAKVWEEDEEGQQKSTPEGGAGKPGATGASEEEDVDVDDEAEAEAEATGSKAQATNVHVSILAVREDAASVLAVAPGVGLRDFVFDCVLSETAAQKDPYSLCAQRLVMDFLNGLNASVICYGQTGSGKTYTMFGPPGKASSREQHGIVPRACEEVLRSMQQRRARGVEMELGMSYVEVFGSEVSDLLREGRVVGQGFEGRYAEVRATDRVGHRYVLDGRTECLVESWEEVQSLLEAGDHAKRMAATAMNERSTRAHTLLVLSLTQTLPSGHQVRSRLFLADLGGSEKISKSKADAGTVAPVTMVGGVEEHRVGWREYYHRRQRIQETLQINKGLFALKKVIEALHLRSQMREQRAPAHTLPYVPYQDSKLTMILKDALGGNSRTLVFCTASMDPSHALESLQTLRFGERCAQVRQQRAADKAASVQAALRQLAEDIRAVEAEIVRKERWETRLVRRQDVDTVAGAFGAQYGSVLREEVIPTSVLVGAEREREHLERLLQRQLDLQGLSGSAAKDYREMAAQEADDGGKGRDFREKDRFRSKMKAKDFEEEVVLADALRFLFRKAALAGELLGESEATVRKRLPPSAIHQGYYRIAEWLRTKWEDESVAGSEKRSFGKAMLDFCQELTASFKESPFKRDEVLEDLAAQVPGLRGGGAAASAGDGA